MLLSAGIYSLLILVVNVGFTFLYFGYDVIQLGNFLMIAFVNAETLWLFYTIVGVIYLIMDIKFNKYNLSLMFVFFYFVLRYFIEKLFFGGAVRTIFTDISLFSTYYNGTTSIMNFQFSAIKLCIILFILFLVSSIFYSRKDFIGYEEKI